MYSLLADGEQFWADLSFRPVTFRLSQWWTTMGSVTLRLRRSLQSSSWPVRFSPVHTEAIGGRNRITTFISVSMSCRHRRMASQNILYSIERSIRTVQLGLHYPPHSPQSSRNTTTVCGCWQIAPSVTWGSQHHIHQSVWLVLLPSLPVRIGSQSATED